MGLFKTEEEKEQKQQEKEQKLLAKYGLDTLTNPKDIENLKHITNDLFGSGVLDASVKLNFGRTEDVLQINYQRAMVEQNFMIIRKLCEISEKLK